MDYDQDEDVETDSESMTLEELAEVVSGFVRESDRAISEHHRAWDHADELCWQRREDEEYGKDSDIARLGRARQIIHMTENELVGRSVRFKLKPSKAGQHEKVVSLQDALNALWINDRRLRAHRRLAIRDCIRKGIGMVMTMYEGDDLDQASREINEEDEARAEMSVNDPVRMAVADELEMAAAKEVAARQTGPEEKAPGQLSGRVRMSRLVTSRVDVRSLIIDPHGTDLDDVRYVGRKVIVNIEDLRRDDRYDIPDSWGGGNLENAVSSARSPNDENRSASESSAGQYGVMCEVFVRQPDGTFDLVCIPYDMSVCIRYAPDLLWCGHPYSMLRWDETGDGIYAQSDVDASTDMIQIEQDLMEKAWDGLLRMADDRTYIDSKTNAEETEWKKDDPSSGLKVSVDVPLGRSIHDMIYKEPQAVKPWADIANVMTMVRSLIESTTGQGPNRQGSPLKSDTSATEATLLENTALRMGGHKSDAAMAWHLDIAYRRLATMVQFMAKMDLPYLVHTVGEDAADVVQKLKRRDVEAGLGLTIHFAEELPENDQADFARVAQVFQLVMGNPILMAAVNVPEIISRMFRYTFGAEAKDLLATQDPTLGGLTQQAAASAAAGTAGTQPASRVGGSVG